MFSGRIPAGLCGLLLLAASAAPLAQSTPPTVTFSVSGDVVTLNWTAVPGATGYQLVVVGIGAPIPVGNVLTIAQAVPPGTYLVQVQATAPGLTGPLSNQVTIPVGVAPPAAPASPTNFSAFVNGNNALLAWSLPPGTLSSLLIEVVGGPFAGQVIPLQVITSRLFGGVPSGSHLLQIKAIGSGGVSGPSNVLQLDVPGTPCGGPPIPVSGSAFYGDASVHWPALPGVLGYQLDVLQNGVHVLTAPFGPTATSATGQAGPGNYTINLTALFACGNLSGTTSFVSSSDPPPGPRRPANGVSQNTLTGEVASVTSQVAAAYRGELRASCGNNAWLFRVLNRLRAIDNRYGLLWKRAVVGDMSQDVITYNFADIPDFQASAPHLHSWDVISGHCGGNPVENSQYIGNPAGVALWTIRPYVQYGYTP